MLHVMLFRMLNVSYFYISTSRSMCAVPNAAVFCSSLISCFPGVLLRYCLTDFEKVPAAHFIYGISSVGTFHIHCISVTRSLYFRAFLASILTTFLSPTYLPHYKASHHWRTY